MPTDCYIRRRVRARAKDEKSKGRHGGEICAHGRNRGVPEGGGIYFNETLKGRRWWEGRLLSAGVL